jgi:hypothetical protein
MKYLKKFNESSKQKFTVLYEVEDWEADLHHDEEFDFDPIETGYSDDEMITMKAIVDADNQEDANNHVLNKYDTAVLR